MKRGTWLGLTVGFVVAVACASNGGEGSETHFVCGSDAECAARGAGMCIEKRCVAPESGAGGSDGSGGRASGSGGKAADSAPLLCAAGEQLWNPQGEYAPKYGCHEARRVASSEVPACASTETRQCPKLGSTPYGGYGDLPCGACTPGDACKLEIGAFCDCDGDGPEQPFYGANNTAPPYADLWVCQCNGAEWECLLKDQLATSCTGVCPHVPDEVPQLCPAGDAVGTPFAPNYGCHESVRVGEQDNVACRNDSATRECSSAIIQPSELPCGTCTSGDRCYASVAEWCDCDGAGPEPAFPQFPDDESGYNDGWLCQCNGGQWQCLLRDQSGISCSQLTCPRGADAGRDAQ